MDGSIVCVWELVDSSLTFCWCDLRVKLSSGSVDMSITQYGQNVANSNFTREQFKDSILQVKEHILAGDIFQLVLSQRFERRTFADPFEVYRALRIVNPSPYMIYLQVYFPFLYPLSDLGEGDNCYGHA